MNVLVNRFRFIHPALLQQGVLTIQDFLRIDFTNLRNHLVNLELIFSIKYIPVCSYFCFLGSVSCPTGKFSFILSTGEKWKQRAQNGD